MRSNLSMNYSRPSWRHRLPPRVGARRSTFHFVLSSANSGRTTPVRSSRSELVRANTRMPSVALRKRRARSAAGSLVRIVPSDWPLAMQSRRYFSIRSKTFVTRSRKSASCGATSSAVLTTKHPFCRASASTSSMRSSKYRSNACKGCVYRKLMLGRNGDEVRPGWRMN